MQSAQSGKRLNPRLRQILSILRRERLVQGLSPQKLRRILEQLGPTFVKIGQILSMREDLLPRAYCEELSLLRASVEPMPFELVRRMLEEELGPERLAQVAWIDPAPLGSASMAQAHRALLLPDRREVVLKVQRPGIEKTMGEDIGLLKRAAALMGVVPGIGETIDFPRVLEEMWRVTREELDFLIEASHLERFRQLHAGIAYTACPRVERAFTTARVLAMEYIDGIRIDEVDALTAAGYDMAEIGAKLAESYIKQVMDDAFFHADPHPGNLCIRGGQIVWMDMGMMGTLSRRDQALIKKAFMGVANHDVGAVKEVVLTLGAARAPVNHAQLYGDIDLLILRYAGLELKEMNLGAILQELLEMAQRHAIALPPGVSMLMRGLMTIEGLIERCAPETSFLMVAKAHLMDGWFAQLDPKAEAGKLLKGGFTSAARLLELPGKLSELTGMMIKGENKLNLELVGSEAPLKALDRMATRISLSLVAAALFIGSALLCFTPMEPRLLGVPALGLAGMAAGLLLSGGIVARALRGRLHR